MRNILAVLAAAVAAGCVVAGCGELAVYEAPDAGGDVVMVRDGARADSAGDSAGDSRESDGGSADDGGDGAVDAGTDSVVADGGADGATDEAADVQVDVQADVQPDVQPDTATCAPGTVACTVGGPCEAIGTTDQSCGACPGIVCGAGFSCIMPGGFQFVECCHAMAQPRGCDNCPAPAGCLTLPTGVSYCCQN